MITCFVVWESQIVLVYINEMCMPNDATISNKFKLAKKREKLNNCNWLCYSKTMGVYRLLFPVLQNVCLKIYIWNDSGSQERTISIIEAIKKLSANPQITVKLLHLCIQSSMQCIWTQCDRVPWYFIYFILFYMLLQLGENIMRES